LLINQCSTKYLISDYLTICNIWVIILEMLAGDRCKLSVRPSSEERTTNRRLALPSPKASGWRELGLASFVVNESTRQMREEFATIGLLAAQVLAAAARARDGEDLDSVDKRALNAASQVFRSFARRIRFVTSGGTGEAPHTLLSAGVTNDVVLPKSLPADPEKIALAFDEIASELDQLASGQAPPRLAADIYGRFKKIAERARVGAGSSGHQSARPNTPRF
jgi:hypothetical protein